MDKVQVYYVKASYPYYDKEQGMMVETSLTQEFIAADKKHAIDVGVAWAKNRFENVFKDFYSKSCLGSVKIGNKSIGYGLQDGTIDTFVCPYFFEWKYDYPGTLEDWIQDAKFSKEN